MQYEITETYTTFHYELAEVKEPLTDEQIKEDLQTAARALSKFCAERLQSEISYMEIKELKDLAKIAIDLYRAFLGSSDITINNIQQNVSQTQLQMFKQSIKNEI